MIKILKSKIENIKITKIDNEEVGVIKIPSNLMKELNLRFYEEVYLISDTIKSTLYIEPGYENEVTINSFGDILKVGDRITLLSFMLVDGTKEIKNLSKFALKKSF